MACGVQTRGGWTTILLVACTIKMACGVRNDLWSLLLNTPGGVRNGSERSKGWIDEGWRRLLQLVRNGSERTSGFEMACAVLDGGRNQLVRFRWDLFVSNSAIKPPSLQLVVWTMWIAVYVE
jgi:hypothetical protein